MIGGQRRCATALELSTGRTVKPLYRSLLKASAFLKALSNSAPHIGRDGRFCPKRTRLPKACVDSIPIIHSNIGKPTDFPI
jgi:hypothetical protein